MLLLDLMSPICITVIETKSKWRGVQSLRPKGAGGENQFSSYNIISCNRVVGDEQEENCIKIGPYVAEIL